MGHRIKNKTIRRIFGRLANPQGIVKAIQELEQHEPDFMHWVIDSTNEDVASFFAAEKNTDTVEKLVSGVANLLKRAKIYGFLMCQGGYEDTLPSSLVTEKSTGNLKIINLKRGVSSCEEAHARLKAFLDGTRDQI